MSIVTRQPTANETPDSSQVGGDLAVTGNTNTGHASTTSSAVDGALQDKTCRWSGFLAVGGQKKSVTLKFDHTSSGSLSGPSPNNAFLVDYSLNGGTNWTTAVQRAAFTTSEGPTTHSVSLPVTQDLTQVQVRDLIEAAGNVAGDNASATATIADIRIEVETVDAPVIIMM